MHPIVIIGKQMFDSLKPFYVNTLEKKNVCCCIYHVEIDELCIGYNFMREKSSLHNSSECTCKCEDCYRING